MRMLLKKRITIHLMKNNFSSLVLFIFLFVLWRPRYWKEYFNKATKTVKNVPFYVNEKTT